MDFTPSPLPLSDTIAFSALPFLFQQRFVELCPAKTLLPFSCTSKNSKQLISKRPLINSVIFDVRKCCSMKRCECVEGKRCRNVSMKNLKRRYEVSDSVVIKHKASMIPGHNFTHQNFNINFAIAAGFLNFSVKLKPILHINQRLTFCELNLESFMINFDALITLMQQPLKKFIFRGGINFDCGGYGELKKGFELIAQKETVSMTIVLYSCSFTNEATEKLIHFLIDNVRGFSERRYQTTEITYSNLPQKELLKLCISDPL